MGIPWKEQWTSTGDGFRGGAGGGDCWVNFDLEWLRLARWKNSVTSLTEEGEGRMCLENRMQLMGRGSRGGGKGG